MKILMALLWIYYGAMLLALPAWLLLAWLAQ